MTIILCRVMSNFNMFKIFFITVKFLKIRTPEKFAVTTLKVEQDGFSLE